MNKDDPTRTDAEANAQSGRSAWTPGPWEVGSKFVGPLEIRAGDLVIAHVGHEDFRTCAANAELMAAAPELADALRGLTEQAKLIYRRPGDPYAVALERAQAALAKLEAER